MRRTIESTEFLARHRKSEQDFTRVRKLSFSRMILLALTRSVESLQQRLNEAQRILQRLLMGFQGGSVSASAYSQARAKLRHSAFEALNREVFLPIYYAPAESEDDVKPQYWRGFRLVGIDASDIVIPNTPELLKVFGGRSFKIANQQKPGEYISGKHAAALAVISYDLLNDLALDARLQACASDEVQGALSMIAASAPNDLFITDRGFASYRYMATCLHYGRNFLTRAPKSMYRQLQAQARANADKSAVGTITMPYHQRTAMQALGLPQQITIRCILVELSTGEEEVLFTSLLDAEVYESQEFSPLYALRWEEETFFDHAKNVMNIELFSGLSEESARQDFWATLLVSNMERLFSAEAQERLEAKSKENRYEQQVNRSVAFSTLRGAVIELVLSSERSIDELLAQLTVLFMQTPVPRRANRSFPRTKPTPTQRVRFYKYIRKPAS